MSDLTLITEIKTCIEQSLNAGKRNFIIFPYGDVELKVSEILKCCYEIEADYILLIIIYLNTPPKLNLLVF